MVNRIIPLAEVKRGTSGIYVDDVRDMLIRSFMKNRSYWIGECEYESAEKVRALIGKGRVFFQRQRSNCTEVLIDVVGEKSVDFWLICYSRKPMQPLKDVTGCAVLPALPLYRTCHMKHYLKSDILL